MNGSKNNIANRGESGVKICSTCKSPVTSIKIIRNGKSRLIRKCSCGLLSHNTTDLKAILG